MFGRSIFLFVFILACLAVGTIALIESQTGKDIFPRDLSFIPRHKISQAYAATRIEAQYWWSKVMDEKPRHASVISNDKTDIKKPEIKKWQDKDGIWHFEYEKTPPSNNP